MAIKNPVPQQFARLLISRNVRQIQQECNVKINWENEKEDVIFCIKGSRVNCERARSMMHTYMVSISRVGMKWRNSGNYMDGLNDLT